MREKLVSEQAPPDIDVTTANVARIYDYFLGGKDNFAVDRAAADRLTAAVPHVPIVARQNRAFILRAVRTLAAEYGIRQFIDVGAGLPSGPSVHSAARAVARGCRVVYVDNDPVVCSHGRALLEGDMSAMVEADLREPEKIINDPLTRSLIDFAEPFALILAAVLHFVPDEADPRGILARFRNAMAPGSFLVISHGTFETTPGDGDERARQAAQVYSQASAPLSMRSLDEVRALFDGFELIDPGVGWISQWRPDTPDETTETLLGGVGLLRG
jgi:hypothetical protein